MNVDLARAFIRDNHRAVLATTRSGGGVQMVPVLIALDENGYAVISTTGPSAKVKNLRRNPYAYAVVLNDRFYGDWIQIEGPVTIETLPGAMEGLVRYYRSISGEHPDWEDYRRAMERDQRVLVRIEIERVVATVSG
jgi:PPOX class probable F420-dependent enzyme